MYVLRRWIVLNHKIKSALVIFIEIAVLAGILYIFSLFFIKDPRAVKREKKLQENAFNTINRINVFCALNNEDLPFIFE